MTDWIEWRGGQFLGPPNAIVQIRTRRGNTAIEIAKHLDWTHWVDRPKNTVACWGGSEENDIVAYRIRGESTKPEEPKPSQPWIEFPRWYRHDGGPAPCPPEIWVEVPGQYAVVRREHAATIQWYGIQYWRPADDRYEFKFDGDRLVAYRLKESGR